VCFVQIWVFNRTIATVTKLSVSLIFCVRRFTLIFRLVTCYTAQRGLFKLQRAHPLPEYTYPADP
jgi:hypothetical protein